MTLGSGAQHSERNHSATEPMQFIQLWILPAQRGLPPSVEQIQYTAEDRANRLLRIVRPEGSEGAGVVVHQKAIVYVARLDAGRAVEHRFGPGRGGYCYLISGVLDLNGEPLTTGDAAEILGSGLLRVQSSETSELIVVDTPL